MWEGNRSGLWLSQGSPGNKGRLSAVKPATKASPCLRPGLSITDPWVAQGSSSSLSLHFLICVMGLIITAS